MDKAVEITPEGVAVDRFFTMFWSLSEEDQRKAVEALGWSPVGYEPTQKAISTNQIAVERPSEEGK
jgi:hypothetical protein